MRWLRVSLRALGILGVAGGLLDPGCARARRPVIEATVLAGVPDAAAEVARLAAAAPWADVRRADGDDPAAATDVAARIVVGDAGAALTLLRERGAAMVVRPAGDALAMAHVGAPVDAAVGVTTDILVRLAAVPSARGQVRVRVVDTARDVEVATGTSAPTAPGQAPPLAVRVPWLPVSPGHVRLRISAAWEGEGVVRPASPADVDVRVRDLQIAVDVLEARPSWGARFARLALEGARGLTVRSETRVAPGLTTGADDAQVASGRDLAHLTIAGGVEALTSADVTRLAADVQERGRTVVLVLDAPPTAGPWTRLWPQPVGLVRTAAAVQPAHIGSHRWHVREWLAPGPATDAQPLAYLDEGTPVIWGRAAGGGRIVLISALDAWRWRADAGTDFAGGWRALVTSLALEQPRPLSLRPWLGYSEDGRVVGLAVTTGPDTAAADVRVTPGEAIDAWGQSVPLWSPAPGQWRGTAPWPAGRRVNVAARTMEQGRVVAEDAAVIDVSPPALVGAWPDVVRHQASVGALAATDAEAPRALSALRAALDAPPGARWHVTRTWWYAALVLAVLGFEWILRRLHRER